MGLRLCSRHLIPEYQLTHMPSTSGNHTSGNNNNGPDVIQHNVESSSWQVNNLIKSFSFINLKKIAEDRFRRNKSKNSQNQPIHYILQEIWNSIRLDHFKNLQRERFSLVLSNSFQQISLPHTG